MREKLKINCRESDTLFVRAGMVTPALKAHFQAQGIEIIPRQGGAETVAAMLTDAAATQCLVGNWRLPPVAPAADVLVVRRTFRASANPALADHAIKANPSARTVSHSPTS